MQSVWPLTRRAWVRRVGWWLTGAAVWVAFAHAVLAQPPRPNQPLPILPLTQIDERAASADLDNRTFTHLFSEPTSINDVLLTLVRGTGLSIVPDASISGTFVGELKNVTVRQALDIALSSAGLEYTVDGSIVRVFRRTPQTRLFDLNLIATERVGSSSVGVAADRTSATVTTTNRGDVFADLATGIRTLLSAGGTYSLDRKAGVLQVTDNPDRLDRVATYLDVVHERMNRQAQIEARVLEIELNDDKASGVDWAAVAVQVAASTESRPAGRPRTTLTSLRVTDVARLLSLLEAQGKVTVVSTPRFQILHNEPAIIRTEALTLSVTPLISADALLTLSLTPIVAKPAIAESDTIARVADGETLVVSGFTRDRETRERRTGSATGGWFGRSTVVTRKRVELVILLTPRIVPGVLAQ